MIDMDSAIHVFHDDGIFQLMHWTFGTEKKKSKTRKFVFYLSTFILIWCNSKWDMAGGSKSSIYSLIFHMKFSITVKNQIPYLIHQSQNLSWCLCTNKKATIRSETNAVYLLHCSSSQKIIHSVYLIFFPVCELILWNYSCRLWMAFETRDPNPDLR